MSPRIEDEEALDLVAAADRLESVAAELLSLSRKLRAVRSGVREVEEGDDDRADKANKADKADKVDKADEVDEANEADEADEVRMSGIDGDTGRYTFRGTTLASLARTVPTNPAADADEEREIENRRFREKEHLGPIEGVDPEDLSQAGWGVIFAEGGSPEVRENLRPLLDHRREQAGRYFRELHVRPGETVTGFLGRFDRRPGPANPAKVPYYLLIAGGPEEIPYGFEHLLCVNYAVGRLHFDHPEDYATYARGVVAAETAERATAAAGPLGDQGGERVPRATFFGPSNPDDKTTGQTSEHLVRRLAGWAREQPDWRVRELVAGDATKAALADQLRAGETPALLFLAAHGLSFSSGSRRQRGEQGAILCQDWPGPKRWHDPIPRQHYFAAADIDDNMAVHGLVAFQFVCHGCGTPRFDNFAHRRDGPPRKIAPGPFVARLPQRLLAHPRGGALAVIGHFGRTWGWSYISPHTETSQLEVFESTLKRLLDGRPVGWAMEYVRHSFATQAVWLSRWMPKIRSGLNRFSDRELVNNWTAFNDARNYVILGDPAVRLPAGRGEAQP